MIDVTTAGDDGHWDHADIKRLIEYRDQLEAALAAALETIARLDRTSSETHVSPLCAVCDQIKELHPNTHPWTARTTPETVVNHERDCGLTNDAGTCECPQPKIKGDDNV